MDNNYIKNLEGSPYIDEGLWDRLKAKGSAIKQGYRNIFGKEQQVGSVTDSQFNSLFSGFKSKTENTIKLFLKHIKPYEDSKKLSKQNKIDLDNFKRLYNKISKINILKTENRDHINSGGYNMVDFISEAKSDYSPFSILGARAMGDTDAIVKAYKNKLISIYNSFLADLQKIGVNSKDYLLNNIYKKNIGIRDGLEYFLKTIGLKPLIEVPPGKTNTTDSSQSYPYSVPSKDMEKLNVIAPAVSQPSNIQKPVEPTTPTPIPTPTDLNKPEVTSNVPTQSKDATKQIGDSSENKYDKIEYILLNKCLEEIANMFYVEGSESSEKINKTKETKRIVSNKSRGTLYSGVVLVTDKDISYTDENGIIYNRILRFRKDKDKIGYYIEFKTNIYETGKDNVVRPRSITSGGGNVWDILINITSDQVYSIGTSDVSPRNDFDIYTIIKNSNKKLIDIIDFGVKQFGKPTNYNEINKKISYGLMHLILALYQDTTRNVRATEKGKPEIVKSKEKSPTEKPSTEKIKFKEKPPVSSIKFKDIEEPPSKSTEKIKSKDIVKPPIQPIEKQNLKKPPSKQKKKLPTRSKLKEDYNLENSIITDFKDFFLN